MTGPTSDTPGPARFLGGVAVHPVLLAIYPGMALWAANVHEARPEEVWPTLWLPALLTAVVWGVASLALRSARRGALVASVAAVVALNAGRVFGGDPGTTALVVGALLVVGGIVLAWRLAATTEVPVTAIGNVAAVVLVALTLPPIVAAWGPGSGVAVAAGAEGEGGLAGRDIWYIVPDRYPRADTLREEFGHDNSPFLDALEERGFQVAERSLANYPKSAHSLAATWNLQPVDQLVPDPPADGGDWQPLYSLLGDHRLGRLLTEAGYEYLHLGSWWGPTSTATSADRTFRLDTQSEFESVWQVQTILPALVRESDDEATEDLPRRERFRRVNTYQLDALDRLARMPHDRPRFVLAHVLLPHEPYLFEPDGSATTEEQAERRSREQNVLNQLQFVNRRLEALFDQLLSGPPETWPVIVVQSDEGPHPPERTGPSYDWTTASDEALAQKLRTLSAILLPQSDVRLPEDLTGVNTWRYVLDATIGTDFAPIPDPPVEVFPGEDHLYDLHDVSDRVE